MIKVNEFGIVKVNNLIIPKNDMLRQFEKGNQETDIQGNLIEGKGDKGYISYYERKLSMEKELSITGEYANHTPIIVYCGEPDDTIETEDGIIKTDGKYIVCDGVQRTGTAFELGNNTPVRINRVTKERAFEIMISANYHRKQNTAAQFTKFLKAELERNPEITVPELASKYAMSETTINRYLAITTLPNEITENVGEKTGVTLGTAVELAEHIKKLAGNAEVKTSLVLAAKQGNLTEVAKEIDEEQRKAKRAARKLDPVYVPPEPIYNAERARIIISEVENTLQDEPENEYFRGQLDCWERIHMFTSEDKKKHKEAWNKKNKKS